MDDQIPVEERTPLEYLKTNIIIDRHYAPTLEELCNVLDRKIKTTPTWIKYTAEQIVNTCISSATNTQFHFNSSDPLFPRQLFQYMLGHTQDEPPVGQGSAVFSHSNERINERSIERIMDGRDQYQLDQAVHDFEQIFKVSVSKNLLLDFSSVLPQVKLLEHLVQDEHMTHNSLSVILIAVFGRRGFLSNNAIHGIDCLCAHPALDLKHDCRQIGVSNSRTSTAKPHRSDEAEIMTQILLMHPENPDWSNEVADWFYTLLNDESRTRFMGYFEWMDAIVNKVFSPELSYSLLYNLTAQD